MTAAGKSDDFTYEELVDIGKQFDISKPHVIINNTVDVFSAWPAMAKEHGISAEQISHVSGMHRLLR